MIRDTVLQNELHDILNAELREDDPCGGCRFKHAPGPLRTPDESGCNWSQVLIVRHGRFWNNSCAEVIPRVITRVAARWNLMPDQAARLEKRQPRAKVLPVPQEASRETYLYFQLDTNRINSRGTLPAMTRLERWHRDGVIGLLMSDIAHAEAKAGTSARRSRKAVGYIYSRSFDDEPAVRKQIAAILFPAGCRTQNEVNDVRIVHNALRCSYILVTADGAMLRNRDALARLGLRVMTDAEAVGLVEQTIRERDTEARGDAAATGKPVPFWVGKD